MAEYIEKEAATRALTLHDCDSARLKMSICDLPAADVAPIRHGRWLDVQETDMYVPDLKLTATKTDETCSACKARIGFIGQKLYLFDSSCPSCGAKMDLEVPENETL